MAHPPIVQGQIERFVASQNPGATPRSFSNLFATEIRFAESQIRARQAVALFLRSVVNAGFGERAEPRTVTDRGGNYVPVPARDLAETASFPASASAQVPILAGSRQDPFGFVRPDVGRIGFADSLANWRG